jgi:shikimate O-hydroxycinnamoyltransferase
MTRFKCGGITLACNWAHPVADGFSGFHFMKSWAELARGEELSLLPVHDRALLKPRKPLILSDPFAGGHPEFASREESLKEAEGGEIAPVVQVVEITKQGVDEMKREVESGGGGGVRLSRVCYVSPHRSRVRKLLAEPFSLLRAGFRVWIACVFHA